MSIVCYSGIGIVFPITNGIGIGIVFGQPNPVLYILFNWGPD